MRRNVMLDQKNFEKLGHTLKRIFTMPITKTTFREVQSAIINAAQGDKELYTDLTESLIVGQVKPILKGQIDLEIFQWVIDQFHVEVLVSKEVHDKGQYISFITSDLLKQPNGVVFANCIKTVDAEEHRFVTDIESSMQLVQHFVGRLHEAKAVEASKPHFERIHEQLQKLKESVDGLTR